MISRLPSEVIIKLNSIVERGLNVVTGDANGVDKAVQKHLNSMSYGKVKIYHVGSFPRNNLGQWEAVQVQVDERLRGRDMYTQKDRRMAEISDVGMIVWDGKSSGSVQNMLWLVGESKTGIVFHSAIKKFMKIRSMEDVSEVLSGLSEFDLEEIRRKTSLRNAGSDDAEVEHQGSLGF